MANNISWADTYCTTWWGIDSNKETIEIDSYPICD